jgi:hypothetical protein
VIDTCIGQGNVVTVALPNEEPIAAELVRWDAENDLAVSLNAFCVKILVCPYEYMGKKTWWDYNG